MSLYTGSGAEVTQPVLHPTSETEQAKNSLPTAAAFPAVVLSTPPTEGNALQPWPTELAQQMQALRDTLQQARQPLTTAQVAARFKRLKAEKVQPFLATLAALSLVRDTPEGYAA